MRTYKDKVIVITGGATGIGFAFTKAMGQEGGKVVIASRRIEKVNESVEKLRNMGIEVSGTNCDVSKREEVEALKVFVNETYGPVDVLVNNAGFSQEQKRLVDMDMNLYRKLFEINYFGVINCIQVFAEDLMVDNRETAIYNVGSENSLFSGVPNASGYISTKHALLALTESLREEVPDKTYVSLIVPGLVHSELADGFLKGMDSDRFAGTVVNQLKQNQFYCVAHARNIVRINERYEALNLAYNTFAPRYENDDEFDVRIQLQKLMDQIKKENENE